MQRRLLITRILSSPLLFCASSSSSPKPTSEAAHLQPLTPPSDEDTEDASPNSLEISTTETEEYDCPSLNGSAVESQARSLDPIRGGVARRDIPDADDDDYHRGGDDGEARVTRILRRPRKPRNNTDKASLKTSLENGDKSLLVSVAKVLDDIIERISAISDYVAENVSQDTESIESGECASFPLERRYNP